MNTLFNLKTCVEQQLKQNENLQKKIMASNSFKNQQKLSAAFLTQKLWPKSPSGKQTVISISFVQKPTDVNQWENMGKIQQDGKKANYDPIEYEVRNLSKIDGIKKILAERIEPITGFKFEFVPNNGMIRIGFVKTEGAYSLVGTDCTRSQEETTMNFGWLDAATIMHEFGHAIGLIHEHQNPRGKSINWNVDMLNKWAKQTQGWDKETTFRNIIEKYDINQINGSEYDPHSIMLYFFPPQMTLDNKGTSINLRLSQYDVQYTCKIYGLPESTATEFYTKIYGNSSETIPLIETDKAEDEKVYTNTKAPKKEIIINKKNFKKGHNLFSWRNIIILILILIIISLFSYYIYKNFDKIKQQINKSLQKESKPSQPSPQQQPQPSQPSPQPSPTAQSNQQETPAQTEKKPSLLNTQLSKILNLPTSQQQQQIQQQIQKQQQIQQQIQQQDQQKNQQIQQIQQDQQKLKQIQQQQTQEVKQELKQELNEIKKSISNQETIIQEIKETQNKKKRGDNYRPNQEKPLFR